MELKSIYILALVFSLLYQDASSQNRKVIDSLLLRLKTTKPDTTHVKAYIDLYYQYHRTSLDTAMEFAQKAKALSQNLNFTNGLIESTYRLGTGFRFLRNFDMAEKELVQSLKLSDSLGRKINIGNAHSGLGKIYYEKNEFDHAASAYLKALAQLEEAEDRNSEARILNDLGNLYKKQRQNDKALAYFEDALHIVRELDFQPGISACLISVGTVYLNMEMYNKALPYFNESLAIKKKLGDKVGESRCLINLANVNRGLKKYSLAHDQYIDALALAKEVIDPVEINDVLYNLALNEFQRGHFETSLDYGEESLTQSKVNNDACQKSYPSACKVERTFQPHRYFETQGYCHYTSG
jgi:tetratricopeptide (TPR) repeat protein